MLQAHEGGSNKPVASGNEAGSSHQVMQDDILDGDEDVNGPENKCVMLSLDR